MGSFGIEIDEDDGSDGNTTRNKGKNMVSYGSKSCQMLITASMNVKSSRKLVNKVIVTWFYHITIPFNVVDSPYFVKVLEAIRVYGIGYKTLILYELSGPLLKGEKIT